MTINRRQFLACGASAALPPDERRPNLLFVLAGQWRAQTLPGSEEFTLKAPNLARLASEGIRFDRCYATYPLSSPSRATWITGKFPHACDMFDNDLRLPAIAPSFAVQLKKAGYATGYIGKWHLDGKDEPGFVPPGPRRRGFDYWAAFNRGNEYFESLYFRDDPTPIRVKGFEPDYQTGLAEDFIRRNKQNPFYLYLSWGPPHPPRTPPGDVAGLYDPRQFLLRDNVPSGYEAEARKDYAGYYGLCTALDRCMGRLLKTLDEEKLAENTIVIFTSDHGDVLGSHGLDGADLPYEESARIPLLVRHSRLFAAGTLNGLLMSNADCAATLLTLCGAVIPPEVQGRDLTSLWKGGKGERPESVFAEGKMGIEGEWRMIVRGADKLVVDRHDEVTHLYNLGEDPFEMENRAQLGPRRKKDELLALLKDWRKRTLDGRSGSGLRRRG